MYTLLTLFYIRMNVISQSWPSIFEYMSKDYKEQSFKYQWDSKAYHLKCQNGMRREIKWDGMGHPPSPLLLHRHPISEKTGTAHPTVIKTLMRSLIRGVPSLVHHLPKIIKALTKSSTLKQCI